MGVECGWAVWARERLTCPLMWVSSCACASQAPTSAPGHHSNETTPAHTIFTFLIQNITDSDSPFLSLVTSSSTRTRCWPCHQAEEGCESCPRNRGMYKLLARRPFASVLPSHFFASVSQTSHKNLDRYGTTTTERGSDATRRRRGSARQSAKPGLMRQTRRLGWP